MRVFSKFVVVVSLLAALNASLLAAARCEGMHGSEKQVGAATAMVVAAHDQCGMGEYSAPVAVTVSYQSENYVQPRDVGSLLSSLVLSHPSTSQWQTPRLNDLENATSSPVSKQSLNCTFLI